MVASMHTRDVLTDKLTRALAPLRLELEDESERHRGHKGSSGGSHFRALIVSASFEGKSPVARHRLVYDVLADEMRGLVHALALRTLTPAEDAAERAAGTGEQA
jgi:BolA protein